MLPREGGSAVTDDPDDPGGVTKWGISLRTLVKAGRIDLDDDGFFDFDIDRDGDIDAADIRAMPLTVAKDFYREIFFEPYNYKGLLDQCVTNKIFDTSINMGSKQAHRCLQRSIRACGKYVVDDGIFGRNTLKAANVVDPVKLISSLRSEQAAVYRMIISKKSRMSKYQRGWYRRAYDDNH